MLWRLGVSCGAEREINKKKRGWRETERERERERQREREIEREREGEGEVGAGKKRVVSSSLLLRF